MTLVEPVVGGLVPPEPVGGPVGDPATAQVERPVLVQLRGPRDGGSGAERPAAPRAPGPGVDLEIAIPAYNEALRLPETLRRTVDFLRDQPWSSRVVVVDNGSSDGTADVVRAFRAATDEAATDTAVPVELVGCARPGKGAAVRRALLRSRARFVGFFDADLATPVETLCTVMGHLEAGAVAVVGSRYAPGARLVQHQPTTRRLGGAAFRAVSRSVVPGVHDTQCGFKFFDRAALVPALVSCRTTGFAFDVELLRHLQNAGAEILEVPVAWSHADGSSFSPLRDGVSAFRAVLQFQRVAAGRVS
ncbi:Glycosyl transferase family 2 [Blastococcus aggregatus]|uniref:Glycosyl transferase family 2 n=1 Tax=Blastococcus aggregatus TaxID=38502 RepID=A0A285V5Z0_9ACTN|nr:glycosyltransferase [Blastococcus aggregatus]SOC49347.1 Glycosyl transferase family 2 [Blastococcus aggregatus]